MSEQWPVSPSAVALDLLDDQERVIAEHLLVDDPAFAAAVTEQRALSDTLEAMPALMRRPATPPPLRAPEAARSGGRRWALPSLRLALPVAGALAAAAVVVVLAVGGDDAKTPNPVQQASSTLVLKPVKGGAARAELTVTGNTVALVGRDLPPTPRGKHYEAWLARADGSMKPMGGFRVGEDGTVQAEMELNEDLSQYSYIDVSVEPNDGPPVRSGDSVLRAQL